ncbi:ComEC/Rec2 family competence protein [Salmonirosea aquatica]|uniref:DUF4131 domain-containing protein n=1 Tax=Salmonirosea aquatica TaxID=2654236 RepID=A0A7C9F8F5_9BACT|nr:DUF4131 domain-containing protein [Cytophagaceae bacterium SJW1-29]
MYPTQPFVRFLIPLVGGILGTIFLNDRHWLLPGSLSFFLSGLLVVCWVAIRLAPRYRLGTSGFVFFALFCLGILAATLKYSAFQKQISQVENREYDAYVLEVRSLGEKRKASVRYDAQLTSLRVNGEWQQTDARVIVSTEERKNLLSPGTRILIKGRPLSRPARPLNPNEFDYQKYLERKGVAWTVFLPEGTYAQLPSIPAKSLAMWATRFSEWADTELRTHIKTDASYGLVKAMVLARRDDLGADLLNSYIQAGAVHILAVSGLHVGVLFLLLSWVLGDLRKHQKGRFLYLGLIIGFISFYALITGLSPSVVRASLMCVTFAVSQTFRRTHDGVNTLAISAFIILLFDPLALFAVGFQLSYAAVLGILLFYPLVKETVDSKYRVIKWVGQITLVSLAAQVFTFPISIYYFHQFPSYFLLVNPFVISLTPILIYSAIAILAFSWIGWSQLNDLLALWTDGVAKAMNYVVQWPRLLPHYLLENLDFDFLELCFLMIAMLVLYQLLKSRNYTYLRLFFVMCLLFCTYATARSLNQFTSSRLIIHAVSKHTVLSISEGQKGYVIADPEFKTDSLAYNFHLKNYFITHGIATVQFLELPNKALSRPVRIDYIHYPIVFDSSVPAHEKGLTILREKRFPRMSSLATYPNSLFVVSQELGFKTKNQWLNLLDRSGNRVVDPSESGALEVP